MTSNGVSVENGSKTINLCKAKHSIANGTYVDNKDITNGEADVKLPAKKQYRELTKTQADIVRLMGQHLREMGYNETLESLVAESGCPLEHPNASSFRAHVLSGDWDKANCSLNDLSPLLEDNTSIDRMRHLLLEEKYLEQLENDQEMEALHTLRHELAPLPLHHSDKHIQTLTSYMMFPNKDDLREAASWPGVKAGSRKILVDKLQGFLPASVMLPPRRLQKLLTQAQDLQVEKCPFHYLDQDTGNYSLLTDHICSKSQFPCEMVGTLTDHSDEVWFLKFSHNGSKLASGSKDGQIIIWDFEDSQPSKERVLKGQGDGIAYLEWSPNDELLLACGKEGTADVIVFTVETGEVRCHIQNAAEDSLNCGAWATCGEMFYVGGLKGQFYQCSLGGSVVGSWEGVRVRALATHPSTDLVYAADTHYRIRQYNFTDKTSNTLINESHPIMSFVLSSDGRQALVNVSTQSVHVWDLRDRVLLRRYQGVTQGLYTIHSSYGGVNDTFLASGSEDNNVYIWHSRRETPVAVLKGHSRTVNSVSWNPVHFQTLVSGSDDGTVRIWGTEEQRRVLDYRDKEGSLATRREETSTHDSSGIQSAYLEHEGMDTQHSESTSELERTEESASSLSLSSEQLHDNLVSLAVDTITQSPRIEPIRFRSGSHPERRPPRTDSGQWSTASEPGDSASAIMTRLRSSSHGQDSSVDPDSSALSLDSSNGSQGDMSQSEFEEGIRFSAQSGVIRTAPQQQRRSSRTRDTQQQEDEEGDGDMSTVV